MLDFLLFLLATVGLTAILVEGKLFDWLRNLADRWLPEKLADLFHCYQCMGTWCGFVLGYLMISHDWVKVLACGFASSGLSALYAILVQYLVARSVINIGEDE